MKRIPVLAKMFDTETILSKNVHELFCKKFEKSYDMKFNTQDIRLIITLVENKAPNSYNTAFVFLTLYGTNRNLSLIFLLIGLVTLVLNILQKHLPIYGFMLIIFSVISFIGYIRFYRYFIVQIISSYLYINE
jgi:hypothetical protein